MSSPRLSGLQRTVLGLALANRETEGRDTDTPGADVTYAEILVVFYGWEPMGPLRRADGTRMYGSQRFSKAEIGARLPNWTRRPPGSSTATSPRCGSTAAAMTKRNRREHDLLADPRKRERPRSPKAPGAE